MGIKSSAGKEKRWKESDKDNATQTYTNGFVGTQDKQKLSLEALGLQMITNAEHLLRWIMLAVLAECPQSVRTLAFMTFIPFVFRFSFTLTFKFLLFLLA